MQNMGLPPGAAQWARELEAGMAKLREVEAIARRICTDFGLDFSDPSRGLSTGTTPSVQNPIQLKLPSLQDLDIRDAQDGDLLTFDGKRGVWVARRHDTVQLPKTFPQGDPASYITTPSATYTVADTPSVKKMAKNLFTDPSLENGITGWTVGNVQPNMTLTLSSSAAQVYAGTQAMKVAVTSGGASGTTSGWLTFTGLPTGIKSFNIQTYLPANDAVNDPISVRPEILFLSAGSVVASALGNTTRVADAPAGWYWGFCDGPTYAGAYDAVELRINITMPFGQNVDLWFDELYVGTEFPVESKVNFNGSTPDSNDFDYSWDGPINASTSTGIQRRQITAPGNVPVGTPAQVLGTGFNASESVTLTGAGNTVTVTADTTGAFDARLPIASSTALGAGTITATGSFTPAPTVNVTYV